MCTSNCENIFEKLSAQKVNLQYLRASTHLQISFFLLRKLKKLHKHGFVFISNYAASCSIQYDDVRTQMQDNNKLVQYAHARLDMLAKIQCVTGFRSRR